jgi:hypothetical protein
MKEDEKTGFCISIGWDGSLRQNVLRNTYAVKRLVGGPKLSWSDNIKIDLNGTLEYGLDLSNSRRFLFVCSSGSEASGLLESRDCIEHSNSH